MRRRAYLLWIGSALVVPVLPSATSAQQRVHRLAFVHSGIPADKLTESAGPFCARRVYQTLRELGDVEGQNLIVERFSADGLSVSEIRSGHNDGGVRQGPTAVECFRPAGRVW